MAVYLFALGAALLFGLGSVIQQRVAFDAPPGKSLKLTLLLWLVRQPVWLAGVGTAVVGNLLSGAALGIGSVALVQPLLVSRLLFALPLSAAWMRQRLVRRDWLGVLATAGGLAGFVALGHPREASQGTTPEAWRWIVTAGAIGAVIVVLIVVARPLTSIRKAPMLGASAGMLFGLQSGLTHTAVRQFIDNGLTGLLLSWATYSVAVTAILGTLLAQSAYEMAPLAASYPALAAIEPLTGIGIGVGVLGGAIALDAVPLTVEIIGLAVMTFGIYLLATSPLVTGQRSAIRRREDEELAYRFEDELKRQLAKLDGDLGRLGEARPLHRHTSLETVCDDLARVDALIGRIGELQEDVSRHRDDEHEEPADTSSSRDNPLHRHEENLDRWQQQIDERAQSLRERAEQLRARVEVLRADG